MPPVFGFVCRLAFLPCGLDRRLAFLPCENRGRLGCRPFGRTSKPKSPLEVVRQAMASEVPIFAFLGASAFHGPLVLSRTVALDRFSRHISLLSPWFDLGVSALIFCVARWTGRAWIGWKWSLRKWIECRIAR